MLVSAQVVVSALDALARDASGLENAAGIGLVVCERAEQVLGGDVGVAHLGGELLGRVAHAHELIAHAHLLVAATDLGLVSHSLIDLLLDSRGIRPNALNDGGQIVLAGAEQGLEQVNGPQLTRLSVGGNAERRLQRLLSRDGPLVYPHSALPSGT